MDRFSKAMQVLTAAGLLTPGPDIEAFVRSELDLPELPEPEKQAPPEEPGETQQAAEPEPAEMPPAYDDDAEAEVDEILRGLRHRAAEAAVRSLATPPRRVDYSAELDALCERYRGLMEGLAKDFREGKIDYNVWVQASKDRIAESVRASYKLGLAEGKGIYPPWSVTLTAQERMAADRLVGKQFDYLLKFREDVQRARAAGEPLTTALDARAALYGGAGVDSFNAAKIAVEGARPLRWNRHAEDSCETCLRLAGTVKTADEWKRGGVWPGHGTACVSNCRCDLGPAE
jgi:hypothetical protein